MDLNEKIKQILAGKNLSPSIFADEIGIQRSSMSHILAGRNKPSLDIVQKIVKRFPELGTSWILDDEDVPLTDLSAKEDTPIQYPSMRGTKNNLAQSAVPAPMNKPAQPAQPAFPDSEVESIKEPPRPERKIDKVLIFYTDGTFEEYRKA